MVLYNKQVEEKEEHTEKNTQHVENLQEQRVKIEINLEKILK
jgi:hypothetical protein